MAITHAKVSGKPDGADATLVRPSDWNADHIGASLLSKNLIFTRAMTAASGNVSYTGVGFKPTCIIFFASQGVGASWGFSDSTLITGGIRWLAGTMGPVSWTILLYDTDSKYQGAHIYSYDADGFTLAWESTPPTIAGTITIYALCLK
jgi:hypothetical protein